MSALEDQADRLLLLANKIRNTTRIREGESTTGPFTRAILETPLGDLIRDVDPSEIGLFTLVSPGSALTHSTSTTNNPSASVNVPQKTEITRVALPIATPLRKPPSGIRRTQGGQRITEHEPEVYVNAGIKLLDRYQSVRPMPRFVERAEAILDQVATVRESINGLNARLRQKESSADTVESPEARIRTEEQRIADLQTKIAELKKQKESLLTKKRSGTRFGTRTLQSRSKPPAPEPTPATSQADAQEEDFWNTPGVPARTLHFTGDLLTNEQLDISGVDPSMSSPLAHAPTLSRSAKHPKAMQFTARESLAPTSNSREADSSFEDSIVGDASGTGDPDAAASEEDEDVTVVLKKSPPKQDFSDDPSSHAQPLPESESISMVMESQMPGETRTKTRFKITTELENIVAKIWSSMGDTIMPGHSSSKPPRAKETMYVSIVSLL
ncbi:hypothetical protein BC629DRAFT_1472907, partial [Irpex lacteus]